MTAKLSIVLALASTALLGCNNGATLCSDEPGCPRGAAVILPGIEGQGIGSANMRTGLDEGGVNHAIVVHSWGRPLPLLGPLINQMDVLGNREAAKRLARLIEDYIDEHPEAAVHLIGHSGGGGIAVFTLEELRSGYQIDGAILLHASISADYDLRQALAHSRKGIVNFWSPRDFALLGVGTTVVGNVDGGHGASAGAAGFETPGGRVYQIEWDESMSRFGYYGGHVDAVNSRFIANVVAPWVMAKTWPVR